MLYNSNCTCLIFCLNHGAGVTFVGLEGEEKDKVVVIGKGVDAAGLVLRLRKKVGFADIVSVTDVDTS